jgi:hypothetical protein
MLAVSLPAESGIFPKREDKSSGRGKGAQSGPFAFFFSN